MIDASQQLLQADRRSVQRDREKICFLLTILRFAVIAKFTYIYLNTCWLFTFNNSLTMGPWYIVPSKNHNREIKIGFFIPSWKES